jgi:SWI/SNF-related matrix-associated actin-dependent regulator of chromatin subfamily A-like protein 1
MGLGKTIQALTIGIYYKAEWPLLIIAPSSLKDNWNNEIKKWYSEIKDIKIKIINKSEEDMEFEDINIISYNLLNSDITLEKIKNQKFKVIICDESHFIKSDNANRTKNVIEIIKDSKRSILLSGTITPNKPIECYTQIKMLYFKDLKKNEFAKRYCDLKNGDFGMDYSGCSNLLELNLLLSNTVMIRRLKKDVLKDLPKKSRKEIFLEIEKDNMKDMKGLSSLEKMNMIGEIKLDQITKYIKELLKTVNKFLLFAHHQNVLDGVENFLKDVLKIQYIRIDGNTPLKNRTSISDEFKENDNIKVALLSITCAGTGLSFLPCYNVVFAEIFWSPGVLQQCEGFLSIIINR